MSLLNIIKALNIVAFLQKSFKSSNPNIEGAQKVHILNEKPNDPPILDKISIWFVNNI